MSWLDTIKALAPTVASALGGPLAGAAVTAIGALIGLSEPTQDKIKAVIENGSLTGEQISGLRQLEMKYKDEEAERGFRYSELEFKNVDSARERDAKIVAVTGHNYRADTMYVLAVMVICGLVFLIWRDQDVNEYLKGIITLVLGRFLGYLDNIYNFEFGTTRVNRAKDETINTLANK
ncbi:MAG TPA: hypothetical protein PKV77_09125 [Bacteroidales bacterium]|nr:hypothetical protein [Bacteroidales bacterium]